jgi:hypothetical protein
MPDDFVFVWQRSPGPTVRTGDVAVTPIARRIGVHWPGGGLLWSFPVAVEIASGETVETKAIVDVTRILIIALWFGTALAVWSARGSRRKRT